MKDIPAERVGESVPQQLLPMAHHHHHHKHGKDLREDENERRRQLSKARAIQYAAESKLVNDTSGEKGKVVRFTKYGPLELETTRVAKKQSQDLNQPSQQNNVPVVPDLKKHHKHHGNHRHPRHPRQKDEDVTELVLLISPEKNGKASSVETLYNNKEVFSDSDENEIIPTGTTKASKAQSEGMIRAKYQNLSRTRTERIAEVERLMQERERTIVPSKAATEQNGKEKSEERPEYASNPREFTKSGSPIPFWQLEMMKGPEYLVRLHRHYGKRYRHERAPVHKADLDVLSINTVDSNTSFKNFEDIYHDGLKRLIPLDRIFLFHRVEITKGIFLRDTFDNYHILNHHGHILYRVREEPIKHCLKKIYTFCDYWGKEFMQLDKTGRRYHILCPLGNGVGFVVPHLKFIGQQKVSIHDENDTELIQFEKLPQKCSCDKSEDIIFEYQSIRGQGPLGMITKKLANLKMSNFSENDYYGIKIHLDLSPNIKAIIMAAWFIIYKLHYEGKTYQEVHHSLTKAAKKLFEDSKPSTEELPHELKGDIVLMDREADSDD